MNDQVRTLTPQQFCQAYQVSMSSLYLMWSRGEGPASVRLGRKRLIRREVADEWIKAREANYSTPQSVG